jgi:hypothetical protein
MDLDAQLSQSKDPRAVKARYLLELVRKSADSALVMRDRNRGRARLIYVMTVVLSTIATILLGVQVDVATGTEFKRYAFIIGAIVTLLNALDPFFNYRSSWTAYDQALADFYRIRTLLEYDLTGTNAAQLDPVKLDQYRDAHQAVWDRVQKIWRESRRLTEAGAEEA